MEPIVSVFVTVYNEQTWVEKAVRSVLDQSLRDIEVLIVDDGSTDGTRTILDGIDDPRLRVLHRPREGRATALAFATRTCRGKYLANLDADDEAFPDRLMEQSRFLERTARLRLAGKRRTAGGSESRRADSSGLPRDG